MKDLMSLVAICKADLDSLGIKYGRVSNWTVNTRAKCRLGQCIKITAGLFDINISEALLKDDVDDQITLNTPLRMPTLLRKVFVSSSIRMQLIIFD